METQLTKEIKKQLLLQKPCKGWYSAYEVTIKSNWLRHNNQHNIYDRADVVEWDGTEHFTCYEIKISKEDAKSNNIISMFGDKNYIVAPSELANDIKTNPNDYNLDFRLGIISYDVNTKKIKIIRNCSIQKSIKIGDKIQVLEGFAKAASRDFNKIIKKEDN